MSLSEVCHLAEPQSSTKHATVLRHSTAALAKTWLRNGKIKPYDDARNFTKTQEAVEDIHKLSALLTRLEKDSQACVIRGTYIGDEKAATSGAELNTGYVRRVGALFEDAPLHWIMAEIDNYEPSGADPVAEPEKAINEFIMSELPSAFHDAAYHWQLSGSAGHTKNKGKLKAHVWFWLATPRSSAELKQWAKNLDLPIDTSVFNPVQIHYTATPMFEMGVDDPVPRRSGFVAGSLEVEMEWVEGVPSTTKRLSRQQRLAEATGKDAVAVRLAELGAVKSTGPQGELRIVCPLADRHSTESGDSSTVYFPANTGGYARGTFHCLHSGCSGSSQEHFLAAIGIDPFVGLANPAGRIKIPEALYLTTDHANVQRMLKHFKQQLLVSNNRWFVWCGTHWAQDDAAATRLVMRLPRIVKSEADAWRAKDTAPDDKGKTAKIAAALDAWGRRCETRGTIDAALSLAKRVLGLNTSVLDTDNFAFNCANGTVDLRTGAIRPHDPDDYITKYIDLPYVAGTRSAVFERVLAQTQMEEGLDDKPMCHFLKKWFAYCATGSVAEKKLAVMYGKGNNGKTALVEAVAEVFGGYATAAADGMLVLNKADRHSTEVAKLAGMRMVTAEETGAGASLRESLIKSMTGGGTLTARRMREDFFDFKPTFKLQLLTNHRPVIKGQDDGIWTRIMLVPFNAKFGTQEEVASGDATHLVDHSIPEQLRTHESQIGILATILDYAAIWHKEGLNPPPLCMEASREYKANQNRMGQFVEERCEVGETLEGSVRDLYEAYAVWCKEGGGFPVGRNRFVEELSVNVPKLTRGVKRERLATGGTRKDIIVKGVALSGGGDTGF